MAFFDLPLDRLLDYRPDVPEPPGFDTFWDETLAQARGHALAPSVQRVDAGLRLVEVSDVSFAGFGGTPVRGWLSVPAGTSGPLPIVVQFLGYSGGRGLAHQHTLWPSLGYAHLVVDSRGQGWSVGNPGATVDADPAAGHVGVPGMMTTGILDPADHYYRRLYTDAARALEFAAGLDVVDERAMLVTGASQGGALTIAAAGLAPRLGIELAGAMPDVPFLCHFRRAVGLVDTSPYNEVRRFLAVYPDAEQRAYATLDLLDNVHHAKRARVPSLWSVGLMDDVCPPSTVFAAHHAWAGEKRIEVYSHNGHEGGHAWHTARQITFARELLG